MRRLYASVLHTTYWTTTSLRYDQLTRWMLHLCFAMKLKYTVEWAYGPLGRKPVDNDWVFIYRWTVPLCNLSRHMTDKWLGEWVGGLREVSRPFPSTAFLKHSTRSSSSWVDILEPSSGEAASCGLNLPFSVFQIQMLESTPLPPRALVWSHAPMTWMTGKKMLSACAADIYIFFLFITDGCWMSESTSKQKPPQRQETSQNMFPISIMALCRPV